MFSPKIIYINKNDQYNENRNIFIIFNEDSERKLFSWENKSKISAIAFILEKYPDEWQEWLELGLKIKNLPDE